MATPTRTATILRSWNKEINQRWRAFQKSINSYINDNIITNAEEVPLDAGRQRAFMVFLNAEINRLLLANGDNWGAKYQMASYERSLNRTRSELRASGADIPLSPYEAQLAASLGAEQFRSTASLISAVGDMPEIHRTGLDYLFTRQLEALEGWTDALSREVRNITMQGMQQGKGFREMQGDIMKRVGVSKSRAETIARTETIQGYQHGHQNEARNISELLGEEVKMKWITSMDGRERELHASWHNTVVSLEENAARISESPYNCRCAQVAVIE